MSNVTRDRQKQPTLREEILSLDRDLLNLLLRRFNLLEHLRGNRGHLLPVEEKEIREAWQSEAQRFSSDPRVTSQLFSLLQELSFFPKPKRQDSAEKLARGAFNLAPAQKPVALELALPVSAWHAHAWLTLAAFSGKNLKIAHGLMHDAQHALCRALNDLGAHVETHDDNILLTASSPCQAKDLSLHCANSFEVFSLLAAQYIVRPSRLRCTAEGDLKLTNLSPLAHFLPSLGARLAYVVPKTNGFPIRLECSGVLPKKIIIPKDLPASFVEALLLALPFAESATSIYFADHPERQRIVDRTRPLLELAEAQAAEVEPWVFSVNPSVLTIPDDLSLPCETKVAASLFAIIRLLGGQGNFSGLLPSTAASGDLLALFEDLGLQIRADADAHQIHVEAQACTELPKKEVHVSNILLHEATPLLAALWAAYALKGLSLPHLDVESHQKRIVSEFFAALGLEENTEGQLTAANTLSVLWNAPSHDWAMSLALAATARKAEGFKLGNAGIITEIWPKFWAVYNALQGSKVQETEKPATSPSPRRRRIQTNAVATMPREEE
ncbi:MAG: hypothetical protein K6G15_02510 [Desulfovibrio sp.]|nr:hypothetical protein [Desulfovibrio sp.]